MTVIQFTPSATSVFQFQATFDGQVYTCYVVWNVTGQRYYVMCFASKGGLIFVIPLIASPSDYNINMLYGYFTSTTLVFREDSNQFEVS